MGNNVSRRNFMVRTILGVFAFISAVLGVTLGGFAIMPALKKRTPEWSDAGTIEELVIDEPRERRFFEEVKSGWQSKKQERSVWLVRKAGGEVLAYSSHCPHLGCGYRWIPAQQRFECPCHASIFDINGKVLAGPAPRELDTLETRVENGRLFVRYEVFQLGTASKKVV